MSLLHVSEEMKEDGVRMTFGTGGFPDFCYTLDLGEALGSDFVRPSIRSPDLLEIIWPAVCLDGSGYCVGVRVALMGSLWACWIAQTTMDFRVHKGDCADTLRESEGLRGKPSGGRSE